MKTPVAALESHQHCDRRLMSITSSKFSYPQCFGDAQYVLEVFCYAASQCNVEVCARRGEHDLPRHDGATRAPACFFVSSPVGIPIEEQREIFVASQVSDRLLDQQFVFSSWKRHSSCHAVPHAAKTKNTRCSATRSMEQNSRFEKGNYPLHILTLPKVMPRSVA